MTKVPQKTLNWLYSVLSKDYYEANRTYSDVARTLSLYPALSPRTDVHTFDNGVSALLLRLVGTIPVSFRTETYRFPMTVWVPNGYPREPPMVYVTSTEGMIIRPGQHVGGDGRVYHHYLAHWAETWDRSNLVDLIAILQAVFAKEPPVVAKQQQMDRPQPTPHAPPVPPLPQELQRGSPLPSAQQSGQTRPPPPPPKAPPASTTADGESLQSPGRYDAPPPLPPLPGRSPSQRVSGGQIAQNDHYYGTRSEPQYASHPPSIPAPFQDGTYRSSATPLYEGSARAERCRMSEGPPLFHPLPTPRQSSYHSHTPGSGAPHGSKGTYAIQGQGLPPNGLQANQTSFRPPQNIVPPTQTSQFPLQAKPITTGPRPKPKVEDLLTSPFDVALPSPSHQQNIPAPPIPRNPEKDALLLTLSQTLTQNLHSSIQQNQSALMPLRSQQAALSQALQTLESEVASLTQLHQTLTSNSAILQSSLQQADNVIRDAQKRQQRGEVPRIDDILTAPTVVGKQLYETVAQQRGIDAAIWALQTALVRGRVGGDLWARQTRTLAREAFMKRALEDTIADGLGLEKVPI